MLTPSIYRLQKKFEQENVLCEIVPNIGLSVILKFDDLENELLCDNFGQKIDVLVSDDGNGYTVMTTIWLSDKLELNELLITELCNLNRILPTSLPHYTPCNIETANKDTTQVVILSKFVGKIGDAEQDIDNLYTHCFSLCELPLSFSATLKKRLDSDKTEAPETTGGCYIATSVYGSYDCPQVWILRRYRDYNLSTTWHGRLFICVYYAISPTMVKLFGHTTWFKQFWENRLNKMVDKLNSQGVDSTPYKDIEW